MDKPGRKDRILYHDTGKYDYRRYIGHEHGQHMLQAERYGFADIHLTVKLIEIICCVLSSV